MASTPELLYWDTDNSVWVLVKSLVIPKVTAGNFVTGSKYAILSLGNTNWNGAASETISTPAVGLVFTAANAGSGTGVATGPGTYTGTNPVIGLNIEDKLGAPRVANVMLANRPSKPFTQLTGSVVSTDPTSNTQLGPFHEIFKPFTQIRIRDSATFHILFAGRVYKTKNDFTVGEYGKTLVIEARDALDELARNSMHSHQDRTLTAIPPFTALDARSDLIKDIIEDSVHDYASILNHNDPGKFHSSQFDFADYELEEPYRFKGIRKTALQHIHSIAGDDRFTDANDSEVHGYDFYVDPAVVSMLRTAAPPAQQFAYHKRLSEPTTNPQLYGMIVRYQTTEGAPSAHTFRMVGDHDFGETGTETYTHLDVDYEEYQNRGGEIDDDEAWEDYIETYDTKGSQKVARQEQFTILYCNITESGNGSASGKSKVFATPKGTLPMTQASRLFANSGRTQPLGYIQYQSGVGNGQYIILSHTDKVDTQANLKTLSANQTVYESSVNGNSTQFVLTGQGYVANRLGVKRVKQINLRGLDTHEVRRKIALSLAQATADEDSYVYRGYFKIADFPHVKFTGQGGLLTNANDITIQQNTGLTGAATGVGIEKGYVINHSTSTNNYAGYISNVTGQYTVAAATYRMDTVDTASPVGYSWDVSDTYSIIVPIRAGSTIFVDHRWEGIFGNHVITEMSYSWRNGVVGTEITTLGRNQARGALPVEYSDDGPAKQDPTTEVPVNPKGVSLENLEWLYTDYNTLGWRPVGGVGVSTLRIESGGSYTISASNTDTILTGQYLTSPLQPNKEYVLYFDYKVVKTAFRIAIVKPESENTFFPKAHTIVLGYITIGEDRDGGRVNFRKLFGRDSDSTDFNMDARKMITPNSMAATLLFKTMQPYQLNFDVSAGDAANNNEDPHQKVTVSTGTITFADGTNAISSTTTTPAGPTLLTGHDGAGGVLVKYIYFEIAASHKTGDAATIGWTNNYLEATSDRRGLIAVVTKPVDFIAADNDGVAETNTAKSLSIMMFKGHSNTISVDLLAARAIASRHITTGQIIAKDFRTAAGVATGASGSPSGLWFNSTAIKGLSGGTGSYTDITANGNQIEFELRAATGKAYFAGGKIMLDCNGVNVFQAANQTVQVSRLDGGGLKLNASLYPLSFNTDVTTLSSVGHIQTDSDSTGSITYWSNNNKRLVIFSDKLDIVLNASNQDIGLFPNSASGYVKIGNSKGLALMDKKDSSTSLHDSTMDFVGLQSPALGSITNSSMYLLPELDGSEEGKVLAIKTSPIISGGGSPTNPYVATLEWATASGGGSGTVTSGTAGYVAFYPNDAATVNARVAGGIEFVNNTNLKLHGHTNLQSYSLKFEETGSGTDTVSIQGPSFIGTSYTLTLPQDDGDADQVLKTNGSGILDWVDQSSGGDAFKTFAIGTDIYGSGWGSSGSEVATSAEDTLYLIPSGSIILERITTSETGFKWSLAPTVTTAHTWSNTQTFTGGNFLVNSATIRLGDSTSDTMEVYAAGTYVSEQKFDATILLDEEASAGSYGTPSSGYGRLYVKQEDPAHIYFKNDGGDEFDLTSGGGTISSGTANYVAYYTGSTTVGTKIQGGIEFVDNTNLTVHGHLDMNTYQIKVQCNSATTGSGGIKLEDGNASHYVTLKSTYVTTENYDFNFPPDSGTSGEVLSTDGSGNTSWVSNSGSGIDGSGTADYVPKWSDSDTLANSNWKFTGTTLHPASSQGYPIGNNTYPVGVLTLNEGSESSPSLTFQTATSTGMYVGATDTLSLTINGTEEFRVSPTYMATWGSVWINSLTSGSGSYVLWDSTNKYLYYSSSSLKVKTNITDLEIDSSLIYQFNAKSFNLRKIHVNEDRTHTYTDEYEDKRKFGMIAEEVYEVMPELVNTNAEGECESIDYPLLSVLLLSELKKLKARIDILEGN